MSARRSLISLALIAALGGGCNKPAKSRTTAIQPPPNRTTPTDAPAPKVTITGETDRPMDPADLAFAEKAKIPPDVLKAWRKDFFPTWTGWEPKKRVFTTASDPAALEDPIPAFSFGSIVQPRMFEKLPVVPVPFGIEGFASRANDLTFQGVEKQTNLRVLNLGSSGISDPALAEFAKLPNLERLNISHTRITDAGLKQLAPLKGLKSLTIDEGPIKDAGVKNLAPLTGLTHLNLSSLQLSDKSAEVIAGFKQLTRLRLESDGLTAAGAKAIATLPDLRDLSIFLREGETADAAVGELKALKKLERLRLNTGTLTEAGVSHLKEMTWLKELDAEHARFDPKFKAGLQAALPNCTIKFAK